MTLSCEFLSLNNIRPFFGDCAHHGEVRVRPMPKSAQTIREDHSFDTPSFFFLPVRKNIGVRKFVMPEYLDVTRG